MKNIMKTYGSKLPSLVILLVFLLVPLLPIQALPFVLNLLIMAFVYICLSESWNVLAGFCGLLSMGHCAFFGLGAYVTVYMILNLNMHLIPAVLIAILFNAILAGIVGAISIRVKDIFFAMVTLAVAQILFSLSNQWIAVTRGARGLIMPPVFSYSRVTMYYVALALVVLFVLLMQFIRKSRMGTKLIALRENEMLAQSLGVNTGKMKIIATIVSAAMASLVGSFYVIYVRSVQPGSVFTFSVTMKIMIVAFIGGKGTVKGPLLGAIIIIIDELIRGWLGGTYAGLPGILYGIILVVVVLFMPNGLISIFQKQAQRANAQKM